MEQFPELWYTKAGWLYKQSKWIKQWRRRHCKLFGSELLISRRENANPHIVVNLLLLQNVQTSRAFKENAFKLILNDGTIYYFVADFADEQQDWMTVLEAHSKTPPLKIETFNDDRSYVVREDQRFYLYVDGHATKQEVIIPAMSARQRQKLLLSDRRNKPFVITVTDGRTPVVVIELDKKTIESIQPSGLAAIVKKKK